MLPAWIIEGIRRREEKERENRVELPLKAPRPPEDEVSPPPPDDNERGVFQIDLL